MPLIDQLPKFTIFRRGKVAGSTRVIELPPPAPMSVIDETLETLSDLSEATEKNFECVIDKIELNSKRFTELDDTITDNFISLSTEIENLNKLVQTIQSNVSNVSEYKAIIAAKDRLIESLLIELMQSNISKTSQISQMALSASVLQEKICNHEALNQQLVQRLDEKSKPQNSVAAYKANRLP